MKKALAFVAAVTLLLVTGPAAFAYPAKAVYQQFADISQPSWGAPIMKRMVQTGIMQGYQGTGAQSDTFYADPYQPVTRAEFAVLLARSLDVPDSSTTPALADWASVPSWAQPEVAALCNQHVVEGQPGPNGLDYFAGSDYITRAELVAMLERALAQNGGDTGGTTGTTAQNGATSNTTTGPSAGTAGGTTGTTAQNGATSNTTTGPSAGTAGGTTGTAAQNGTTSSTTTSGTTGITTQNGTTSAAAGGTVSPVIPNPFRDVSSQDWYYDYVLAAYQAGIVQGESPGYFGPSNDATRVEVMAMLWRSLTGDKTDLPSDTQLVTPVQTVNNLEREVLAGQDKSQLAPYLTGQAALGLASGNFFLMENAALKNVSGVQVSYPAGSPRVMAKSRYLATVATTVNAELTFTGNTSAPANYQLVEYYHLVRDGNNWLIYAVNTYSVAINGGPPAMVDQDAGINGGF